VVKLPTVEEVLQVHEDVLSDFGGGGEGILDIGRIEAAVARMNAGFGPVELYPGVFEKAAALLEALVSNHGFVDGNKRTAIACAGALLELNGWQLSYEPEEVVEFALGVANHEIELAEIVKWLREQSTRA